MTRRIVIVALSILFVALPAPAARDGWTLVKVPGFWEPLGGPFARYDGFAWYRCFVKVPADWPAGDLHLALGRIDDCDETFFNGVKVGQSGSMPPNYHGESGAERVYKIPAKLVRRGGWNLIAVRVYDKSGGGGIPFGTPALRGPKGTLGLAGRWQIRRGDDPARATWPAKPDSAEALALAERYHKAAPEIGQAVVAPPTLVMPTLTGQAAAPAGRLVAWYRRPAAKWVQASPIGNGRLGAMVFGGAPVERLALNEDTVWAGGPYDPSDPEALEHLPQARQLIFDGKYREAHKLIGKYLMARPLRQMPYQPLGDLWLQFDGHDKLADYRRELDLSAGVARVTYKVGDTTFRRDVFSSQPDQLIVVHVVADKPGKVSFSARLTSPQKATTRIADARTLVMDGSGGEANGIEGEIRFQARARVRAKGGKVTAAGGRVTVTGADEATILISAGTNYVGAKDTSADPVKRAKAPMIASGDKTYAKLLQAHEADYTKLFGRVSLDVGNTPESKRPTDERIRTFIDGKDPQLAELYFQFGRYLLIAGSRPGTQPLTLQGLWNESMRPPWDSKYTININTEMNYWPAEPCNLSECTEPLRRMVSELVDTGSQTAEVNYGARGWVCHHNTDLWRATAPIDGPTWGMWPCGGAWLSMHLWEHYLFTRDAADLRKAYPVLKGAAQFFVDSLVEYPTKKWLVTCPSLSPEHGHPGGASVCAGPTMDTQIIRDLFDACIESAAILKTDADFARTLREKRERLAPMLIGKYGQLQEWLEDWDNPKDHHRHVSHLYGLFPSDQITPGRTPKLFAAARKSLAFRGDGGTGWSKAWKVNFWARLGDGDHAFKMLTELLDKGTLENLFDTCPPFQIDGNFGGTSGVVQMLLQSHPGGARPQADACVIRLLPALPKAWPAGSVRGLRARGAFTVDIAWADGTLTGAAIAADRTAPCRVQAGRAVRVTDGKADVAVRDVADGVIEFPAEAGKTYRLTPR